MVTEEAQGPAQSDVLLGSLVLLRHGESTANACGLFTGMLDVPLTPLGEQEALQAGTLIGAARMQIDAVVTSTQQRTIRTAELVLDVLGAPRPPVESDWRLNERNYGALTGRTKADVLHEVGPDRFLAWRRSMTEAPPPMTLLERNRIAVTATPAGRPRQELGLTESLVDVVHRVRSVLADTVVPLLHERTVLVVAHGNSLRALVSILDQLDTAAVETLNLPTGQPLVYRLSSSGRSTVTGGSWLDPAEAAFAADRIAHEGGT